MVLLLVVGCAVGKRRSVWLSHVGRGQWRRECACVAARRLAVTARRAGTGSVPSTRVAYGVVEHAAPTDHGSRAAAQSTTQSTLGQERLEMTILLGKFVLILRDIAVNLF